jgi:LiaI-LiaF-like transmembrane region
MGQASMQAPPSQPAPPSPPAPGASRYEWRAYRHQMGDYMRYQRRAGLWYGSWGWGVFFAAALVLTGSFYLLRNLGLLPGINDNEFWPVLLILLGVVLLARRAYP